MIRTVSLPFIELTGVVFIAIWLPFIIRLTVAFDPATPMTLAVPNQGDSGFFQADGCISFVGQKKATRFYASGFTTI
ncbi:hypothetical protein [Brumicola pallidula]|jgi:hypothetical protein|uniref:Uncharacterized protein n=1 Tax=Brumicola pallidula DSM 14239 = ACAM 615 TaxID=1121922 RepID=K6YYW2_9ALTE|nr:hypothetical protein [Glaciecola pallidula]GAC29166.1 hypothetical protein GPAL_2305 [Glaciecola pallidula DSM 14239 = ACAM 615]